MQYQFMTSSSAKLYLWALDPPTGSLTETLVPTGSYVRKYVSFAFSKPRQEFLFAGTSSGDFACF